MDRRIIELLSSSSQGSYRQLAKQLGVHPTTLIQRVNNLEAQGVIRGYRAKLDYMAMGYGFMGIARVFLNKSDTMAEERISSLPQTVAVYDVAGDANVVAMLCCRDRKEFLDTIMKIDALDGVVRVESSVILRIAKSESDYVPVLGPDEGSV
ncbi:transcriptional regulator [Candidatus Methanomethylophilus sp. 1R26]|uniref:Lrp/AsnC family transcriptional regulator n=1 Tax=Candidatus Methanomethylophilus sp. 1R26 TaxID=1769296 RepID=UPI0007365505|nr:transcriptional regulator [Candidatus Methanomethylophilus sp. 1R26]